MRDGISRRKKDRVRKSAALQAFGTRRPDFLDHPGLFASNSDAN
jgi:hypothetical protein